MNFIVDLGEDLMNTKTKGKPAGEHTKEPSATKKGPGRYHLDGHKHGAAPKPPKGGVWLGPRVNVEANARRAVKAEIGARQYRKQRKALARAALAV